MKLGIFLGPIAEEAENRGISIKLFPEISKIFAILQYGKHEEYIHNTLTNYVGASQGRILKNKYFQSVLLSEKGYKTPKTQIVNLTNSTKFIQDFNQFPCVVKPLDNYGGRGITVNITNKIDLEKAIKVACDSSKKFKDKCIVQEMVYGSEEYRILVIGNKDVFLVKRTPFRVIGDGIHSIQELIEIYNDNVVKIDKTRFVQVGDSIRNILQEKSLALDYIPKDKEIIKLSYKANSHDGGSSEEMTEFLPESLKQFAIKLSLDFNLPIVGIDIITSDINKPNQCVLELNLTPGLNIHVAPTFGTPTQPQKAIIDLLFPETVLPE